MVVSHLASALPAETNGKDKEKKKRKKKMENGKRKMADACRSCGKKLTFDTRRLCLGLELLFVNSRVPTRSLEEARDLSRPKGSVDQHLGKRHLECNLSLRWPLVILSQMGFL